MISRNKQVSIPSRKEMSGFIKTWAKVSTVTHRSKYSDSWQKKEHTARDRAGGRTPDSIAIVIWAEVLLVVETDTLKI